MNQIEVINNTEEDIPDQKIIDFTELLLTKLKCDHWELPISFVSSAFIQGLNKQYRDQDRSTDVITFNAYENGMIPDLPEILPGDVLISLEDVKDNCKEFHVDLNEELMRVLTHSVLHLLGWNHTSYDFKEDKMLKYQESIVKELKEDGVSIWDS